MNSGITESFINSELSVVLLTKRINPCIVIINHGNVTELSRKIHGTSRGSYVPIP